MYTIQKGKYDTYMRILAKKELQGELPRDKRFTLSEVDIVIAGKHHEEEGDDEEEEEELNQQVYLGREETFASQKLADFEQEARKIVH